jgi:hypothetical protein
MFISPFLAAVIIGSFWTGVGTTAVLSNSDMFDQVRSDVVITATASDDHVADCHARFRSYVEDTDMYLGFDGSWHVCPL